ncbi:hypothetical protein OEZ86_004615 [Tetradesmus obliquus]|nr:hypothetical protein OEZ86_004615 [Tetradesmus obliquus]
MVEQAAGKQLQHGSPHGYGAELTTRQFAVLIVAIALGTLLEWYDFFAYSQLNAYLTKVFFPAGDPAVTQLSFWGVYAVGFISRPVGALLFGHLGDTRGRRICLLVSVTMMAIPTVLIGCLPTFAQAGIAAPILLALLRAIQGLAMGGEFGCAMVYLHEIAPAKAKGLVGSIGFASAMVGCMLGVLVVVIVEAIFSPAQMLIFGWRLPFLLSIISASAAFALRMHMPEPEEFTRERQQHWGGVLLQFLFEAWVSIGFWVISTWLPLQLRKAPVFMPEKISQAMLIVNLSVMGAVQLAAGWASDKGMPRVWSCFAVFTAAAGISVPVFIGFARCGVAGCWLLHLLLMVLMGWVLGVVPATCSSIYPATVRSSGFNLAHNMAMSWLGGVSPTIVTALVAATGSAVLAPGLLLVVAAVVSMVAALALLKYAPAANKSF